MSTVPTPTPAPVDGVPTPPLKTPVEALHSNKWAALFSAIAYGCGVILPYLGMIPSGWAVAATALVGGIAAAAKTWSQVDWSKITGPAA